jgi:hypothetical protein
MKQGVVLALDLATTTGWALHAPGMERPFFDAFTLPGGPRDIGVPCLALEDWLEEMWETFADMGGFSHVCFEAQHINPKMSVENAYRLICLGGIVERCVARWCREVKEKTGKGNMVRVYKVDISTWRKHFLGRGSGFKRDKTKKGKPYFPGEDPKEIAVNRCTQYGWHTDIHDAAEACGILDYFLSLIPNYHRPWRDRALLGGAR